MSIFWCDSCDEMKDSDYELFEDVDGRFLCVDCFNEVDEEIINAILH